MKTVSKDLAKKLREAGFPQENHAFYWVITLTTDYHLSFTDGDTQLLPGFLERNDWFAAPTADEILGQLPELIRTERLGSLTISKYKGEYCLWYANSDRESLFGPIMDFQEESLADTAAKMWLFLKKKDLLDETKRA